MFVHLCDTFPRTENKFVKRFRFSRLNKSTATESDRSPLATHITYAPASIGRGVSVLLVVRLLFSSLHRPFVSGGVCAACDPRVSFGKKPPPTGRVLFFGHSPHLGHTNPHDDSDMTHPWSSVHVVSSSDK